MRCLLALHPTVSMLQKDLGHFLGARVPPIAAIRRSRVPHQLPHHMQAKAQPVCHTRDPQWSGSPGVSCRVVFTSQFFSAPVCCTWVTCVDPTHPRPEFESQQEMLANNCKYKLMHAHVAIRQILAAWSMQHAKCAQGRQAQSDQPHTFWHNFSK